MKIPTNAPYGCLAFEAEGRWITRIARADLRTDLVFGSTLSPPREGSYDPAGRTAPPCWQASIGSAIWSPAAADVLVVASCEDLAHMPPVVIGGLPVVVIALAGRRLWGDVSHDRGKLYHEHEIVAEPARKMTPLMLRAWRTARIVEAMLLAV